MTNFPPNLGWGNNRMELICPLRWRRLRAVGCFLASSGLLIGSSAG